MEAITRHLALPEEDVRALFVASRGTLVMDSRTGRKRWIGSITPARKADGTCIFLEAGRCTIHPVAPFGCAYFDVHMDVREAAPRSSWLARAMDTPLYQALRSLLVPAEVLE